MPTSLALKLRPLSADFDLGFSRLKWGVGVPGTGRWPDVLMAADGTLFRERGIGGMLGSPLVKSLAILCCTLTPSRAWYCCSSWVTSGRPLLASQSTSESPEL